MRPIGLGRGAWRGNREEGFALEILHPGVSLGLGDSGIGAIGRIDRAWARPGHVIGMHPHRDDEILTYLRAGRMLHRDTMGHEQEITASRLMLMNAGHTFQHEEEMLGPEPVEALQIFLRPRAAGLAPQVQFHDLDRVLSRNAWRLLAAPEGAPLTVRAQAWVEDAHLSAGSSLVLPPRGPHVVRLLYAFKGEARIADVVIRDGESVHLGADTATVTATAEVDLVLFTTDPGAAVFRGGMFSGNILAA
ncbi:pirin family protein [Methylobacterium isbiliense]|uniref:Pirin N-terminal domain-containing protein n=1 Tax=Methylobacterium isbiliense TaxID=315478 RepID=A0ABQ4SDV9_9HYPH|nr:pirin family protein [Methylobacterium isbiliense]MDN3621845.1 pirin family protein [Methylobacterium isbiliense]GJD99948.1 hypothetical protein GMJLKIPL_1866 [Methylobacterium isbiliense]